MSSPTIVLDKIIEKLVDIAFESVGRHLGYLFHYKQNMKDLEVEMNKLQQRRETIEGQIGEAKTRGDVILDNVSQWLNGAERLRQGVDTFMEEKTVKENVQCFKFSCPDFISWYKLSKEAEKKMSDVRRLYEVGNFGTNIARRAQFPSIGEYMSFDSRELVFKRIMESLTDSKVNVIGVYGTGGVGKTTMVEKVGERLEKDDLFDEVVMAVVSHDANVAKIQEVLADRLRLKLEAKTEVGKADELWSRLNNGKRNLVILDDTWEKLNLKEIGIPITNGNKSCKVVLTSRNQRVFKDMDVDKDFPIEVLSEEEAWNLFKKKIVNSGDSNDQLHDIAYEVCKECQGLPVAVVAVGAALKGKSMDDWKSSLGKLKKSMLNKIEDIDPQLFTSLRLSYDYLESTDAKSCFLLCCLFPEDAQVPIEELASHCLARRLLCQEPTTLEEARVIVRSVINTLKTRCLLLDGENDDFVKMHDIVRDIAILIAKEEKAFLVKHGVEEWPVTETYEKCSAISLRSETISELPDELVCPELHTLMLECGRRVKISDEFFRGTEKLVVLELNRVTLLPLPSSLEKLKELRMLCLIDCNLVDIAILKYLKNKLEVLRLRGSDIKALPPEVGELTRLRLLDLKYCYELKVIPNGVITKLHLLEELHFPLSFENWEGTTGNEEINKVSLDELMSLTRLSTLAIHIPHHRLLPKDLGFQNLIRFNIRVGATKYYDSTDYSVVVLRGIDIDDDFNILERLLGKPGRSFNNLTQLAIWDCRLKYLFSPSCARGLLQLQSLQIQGSEIMEAVIGNEGENDEEIIANVITFSQLKSLHLDGLPHLISFYPRTKMATTIESHSFPPTLSLFNEKVAFPALEELYINSVPKITEIWDKNLPPAESICLLRFLEVWNCEKLMNVVPSHMLPLLKSIETLKVSECPEMEVIVVFEKREEETQEATNKDMIIMQFPQLRILKLFDLGRLSSFNTSTITETRLLFNYQVAFPALEELYINSVPNITEIWDKNLPPAESFCLLKSLDVWNCKNLMNVVPSHMLPLLKSIETLKVSECPEMEVIVVLEKREEQTQEATNKDMIIVQVAFPALEELYIDSVQNITVIWDKNLSPTNSFCLLRSLEIRNCEKLMNVVPSHMVPQLKSVETLEISRCPEMEVIVVFEKREEETQEASNKDMIVVQFSQLRILELFDLGRRSSFNNTSTITETRPLFNYQVAFPALEELYIDSVQNITVIWDKNLSPTNSFCLLRSLEIRNCEKLMNVVPSHMVPQLKSVETLEISWCPEMEVIVVFEKREEETQEASNKDMIVVQVAFPALEELYIDSVQNITEIWDKNLSPTNSFCLLRSLEIRNCEKLMNVVPSHMVPQLKSVETLEISRCPEMEVIVVFEKREEETQEASNKDMIVVQVAFPALEELYIASVQNITEIWDKNLSPTNSFCLLRSLEIRNCEKLMNVVPSHMVPQLKSAETLEISRCPEMEVIVVFEKREEETQEASNKDMIVVQV
ncbi:hypothetical protein RHSIM_Rhsim05G0218700 [Rhododendron simsii]|uniref:NB-ARC domain-containing protein n=1 Tax=Rhododendron simsii TaxID=118357 RepID=A0A834LNQ7_RHOSS|nr:hypothetical protein RHSIM_Rhsim05G0218700 [Rhododendron simsii]